MKKTTPASAPAAEGDALPAQNIPAQKITYTTRSGERVVLPSEPDQLNEDHAHVEKP